MSTAGQPPRIEVVEVAFNGSSNSFEAVEATAESTDEEADKGCGCLTFTVVDVLNSDNMEDLTSNCLNVQDKIEAERPSNKRSEARRSKSFQHSEKPTRIIPKLNLPVEPLKLEAEMEAVQQPREDKKRKRRRSIVNLLFPKGQSTEKNSSEAENYLLTPSTPSIDQSGGQRLHFRRLSEIICRPKKEDEKSLLKPENEPPKSPFLQQLFPHRRRRSSVSHLDHTPQFKGTSQ